MTGAIEKIHGFERFGSVLGLERMKELMDRLGNPQDGMKFIHVAGTNGKGSVSRYIYEILKENGYKTGLYTSPYILIFNERIEFDGKFITDEELEVCTTEVLAGVNEMTECGLSSPTEFEVVTAIAFVYFRKKRADFIVLEVGLGGKGDSTNIIKEPIISVISSISLDHMDRLGNSTREIAAEKAGIIKKGVPVVSNVSDTEAAKVIAKTAYAMNCAFFDVTRLKPRNVRKSLTSSSFDANFYGTEYNDIEISMIGAHQIQNAMTALAAIEALRKAGRVNIKKIGLYRGLKKARLPGRFEILRRAPYFIIDGAHNEKGAETLKTAMREHFNGRKVLMVIGVLADKDVKGILNHFYEIADDFIATEPNNERRLPAEKLCREINASGKSCIALANSVSACEKAFELGSKYNVILVAGSLYLLGEIRSVIDGKPKFTE